MINPYLAGGAVGGGLLGKLLGQPREAVNSALMATFGPRNVPPPVGTPRDVATGMAGMMAMGGGPGDLGLGRAASAASMMGAMEGIPRTVPTSDFDASYQAQPDAREGSWLPALLGLAAGVGAGISPLAPFAVPIGAGMAGFAQAALNAYDPQKFGSFSTPEMLDAVVGGGESGGWRDRDTWGGWLTDQGVGMLTDPLTYAGGFGGKYVGNRMAGMPGVSLGPTAEGRLAQFAEQAANVKPQLPGLVGTGGTVGVGTPAAVPLLAVPEALAPASAQLGAESAELSPLLQQMQARIAARDAGWAAQSQEGLARSAAMREQMLRAANEGWGEWAAAQPVPPGMTSRADEIRALLGATPTPPQAPAPALAAASAQGESVPWSQAMAPPPSTVRVPPAAVSQTPFALPPELQDLSAGLRPPGYGPAATGNVPVASRAAGAYAGVSPEVQELLLQLGVPSLGRGALPPWARVNFGQVGMRPGILPADVLRGALSAGGYPA